MPCSGSAKKGASPPADGRVGLEEGLVHDEIFLIILFGGYIPWPLLK